MFGASAFGWPYFGEIVEDTAVKIDDSDSRFAVAGFGWPYLGALPGVYVHIKPPTPAPGHGGAVGDVNVYQGGPLYPIIVEKKKKKPEELPVPLPFEKPIEEEQELSEQIEEKIHIDSDDGTVVISPPSTGVETKFEPPAPVLPPAVKPKPKPEPEEVAEPPPVLPEIVPLLVKRNKKKELILAEDQALLGILDGIFSEDAALLDDEL